MSHPLRFQVLVLPNTSWRDLLSRFQQVEALGFDAVGAADHFVDWTNPPSPWFELWTQVAAVAALTERVRICTCVAQIPLRDPATCARQALSMDHISGGRFELGLGIGLPIDPSYAMMGIENWSTRERVARFREYVEVVDALLRNERSSYQGRYYTIEDAIMNPRPVQQPRPPLAIAAMGPVMLSRAARYADIWNSLSFATSFEAQLEETRARIEKVRAECARIGRDPATLRISYTLFEPQARASGGRLRYYESPEQFTQMAEQVLALGVSEIVLCYPLLEAQRPVFERIAREVIPVLRARHGGVG